MLPSTSKSVEVNENSEEPIELEENVIVVTGDEIQAEIAVVDGEEVIFAVINLFFFCLKHQVFFRMMTNI